jgi:hypothetical protein
MKPRALWERLTGLAKRKPSAPPLPPDPSLLAVYRRQGWSIYRDRETGALLGAKPLDYAGRIRRADGSVLAEFQAGDYRVQPWEPGAYPVILPAATAALRLVLVEPDEERGT